MSKDPPPLAPPQGSHLLDPNQTFPELCKTLNIDARLSKALYRLNYTHPTLIQSKSLPLAIAAGRDILLRARTGSGKTLAYTLPLLQKILSSTGGGTGSLTPFASPRAVILVPTRELCRQVHNVIKDLLHYAPPEIQFVSLLASATSHSSSSRDAAEERSAQEALLRDGPAGIVATPAGLLDHVNRGSLSLEGVESLVVDEADLVLSFGYEKDINGILKSLPKIYQGFLMSATLSPEVEDLKRIVLHSPAILKLEEEEDSLTAGGNRLSQFYIELKDSRFEKYLVLYTFLKLGLLRGKGLFFVNDIDGAYRLKLFLEQFHIPTAVLNAELPLKSRLSTIDQFNIGNFDYLIATDEGTESNKQQQQQQSKKKDAEFGASRGLDFRGVSFVVNVDLPASTSSYTHRIGRTARGISRGAALSLITAPNDLPQLELIKTQFPSLKPLDDDAATAAEGFRYRVEDVARGVTRSQVKEARAEELRRAILDSEVLERGGYFEDHKRDWEGLVGGRAPGVRLHRVQEHLKHVPSYLLPRGMQVQEVKKKKKKRKRKDRNEKEGGEKKTKGSSDPLKSFEGGENLDDFLDDAEDNDDDSADEEGALTMSSEAKVYLNMTEAGRSNANRNKWKQRHRKGIYSRRYIQKQPWA